MTNWGVSALHMAGRAEAVGQKLRKPIALIGALGAYGVYQEIRLAEFLHDLTAHTAGRKKSGDHPVLAAAHGDGGEVPMAVVHGLEDSGTFGADGRTEGGVFDVAALIHGAVGTQKGGTHLIVGIGSVGVGHGLTGKLHQLFLVHKISPAMLFPGVSSFTSRSSATVAAMSA